MAHTVCLIPGDGMGPEAPEIGYEEYIIDNGCMHLVRDPSEFAVLLLEDLYGDVASDPCAGLVGGLGVVPGANIGNDCAVFEAGDPREITRDIGGQAGTDAFAAAVIARLEGTA